MAWCTAILDTAHRAARVEAGPVIATSLVRGMALRTKPYILLGTALWHLIGRGDAGMPLFEQPEVSFHGLTKAKFLPLAVTVGANYLAHIPCQQVNPGLPLVVPATFVMDAAWAE